MKFRLSLLVLICFAVFFIFGFLDNLKGPVLPEVLKELNISYSMGGYLVFSSYFGFLLATFLSGFLSDRIGNKKTLISSTLLLITGILLYIAFRNYYLMLGFIFIFGLGLGAIELTGNKIIVDMYNTHRALYLNLLTFAYSLGAFISPFIAGIFFSRYSEWRLLYLLSIFPLILIIFVSFKIKLPDKTSSEKNNTSIKFEPVLYLLFFLMTLYMMAEVGLVSWIVEFLQKAKGLSVRKSNLYLSLFFVGLGGGRLAGSYLVEKFGYVKSLSFSSLLSVVFLSAGIFLCSDYSFLVPFVGLFYSIMFPTITALVSEYNNSGRALGVLFAFAGAGGMFGPALTGIANDILSINYGLLTIPVFCLLIFLIVIRTGKSKQN